MLPHTPEIGSPRSVDLGTSLGRWSKALSKRAGGRVDVQQQQALPSTPPHHEQQAAAAPEQPPLDDQPSMPVVVAFHDFDPPQDTGTQLLTLRVGDHIVATGR